MRENRLRIFLPGVIAAVCTSPLVTAADQQPNVLIIMADDCTHNDLPLYGGQNAKTPNIDALASQGLTFNKAYLASAMCQPCRAELFTGQYPMRKRLCLETIRPVLPTQPAFLNTWESLATESALPERSM